MPINHCRRNICLPHQTQYKILFLICCVVTTIDLTQQVNAVNQHFEVHTDNARLLLCQINIDKPRTGVCLHYALGYTVFVMNAICCGEWNDCLRFVLGFLIHTQQRCYFQCLHGRKCDFTLCCEFILCVSKPMTEPERLFLSKRKCWNSVCSELHVRTLCF